MSIGAVVIGRNEGERLIRCLKSIPASWPVVYVDSGSTDGSLEAAKVHGADAVLLDPRRPFSAARARNAGAARLTVLSPHLEFIQFLDGDCELQASWPQNALTAMHESPTVGVVCGRRRELHVEASIYNRWCDLEWDTPIGPAHACGGDALVRMQAWQAAGGYRADLIAGEEPELCWRLRLAGWQILRIAAEMTRHDAAITRFSQWWKRSVRGGHAFAEISALTAGSCKPLWHREVRSNWIWGLGLPFLTTVSALAFGRGGLILLSGYVALSLKTYLQALKRWSCRDAGFYTGCCVLIKFPQVVGQIRYLWGRFTRHHSSIIEYKTTPTEKSQSGPPDVC